MKQKMILICMLLFCTLGGQNVMAKEFIMQGIKASVWEGNNHIELIHVSLEEGEHGSIINLSIEITLSGCTTEKLFMSIPPLIKNSEVAWSQGLLRLNRYEGFDQYFYTTPEKITWWFELLPIQTKKSNTIESIKANENIKTDNKKTTIYLINGKEVTEQEYQVLKATLKGQEHWICAETSDGGITSWESKDASGQRYRIEDKSGVTNTCSITRIPELKP